MIQKIKNANVYAVLLICFSSALYAEKISFDVRNKNIGFENSPNSDSVDCLAQQTFPGHIATLYLNTAVEPSVAVNPVANNHHHRIVAAWQQDRFFDGGSLEVGIGRSIDGGKSWTQSIVPFQNCNGGFIERISDVWLSYSAQGDNLYLSNLVLNASTDLNTNNQNGIVVTTSHNDGQTWSIPHFVSGSALSMEDPNVDTNQAFHDKPSVTADPSLDTYAYVVWDQFPNFDSFHADTWLSRTTDGGTTWENSQMIYNPFLDPGLNSNGDPNDCQTLNNIIVGLPNGDLLNFMTRIYANHDASDMQYTSDSWPFHFTTFDIAVIRSTDKGLTWNQDATQILVNDTQQVFSCGYFIVGGEIQAGVGTMLRTSALGIFSVAVNPKNGYLYVVCEDSRFNPVTQLPQILLVTSRDGGVTWSDPVQVSRTPSDAPNPQAICPSVAVNGDGHVGILYHDFRSNDAACENVTETLTWFALYEEVANPNGGSTGVGLDFKKEVKVSRNPYIIENGPNTAGFGVMVNGDYESLVVHKDDFHALYIQSNKGTDIPVQTIIDNLSVTGILILNDSERTSPYFSKIDA